MDDPDRLAAVPLIAGESAAQATVERLNGGVKDAARGVQMARTQGVGVKRKARARSGQAVGGQVQRGG